jgi:DNA helicase HerA-like ATPase
MVGHGEMAIPFREALDSGKIVLVKLARGRVGTAIANTLAMQIVNRFYSAAMQRASVPMGKRRPFYLMFDEFRSIADESFLAILSESRKYGLSVTLAIQYLAQLRDRGATRDILPAVLGNAGVVAAFRLGPEDASLLAPWFFPLRQTDLMSIPNLSGYAQVLVSGAE